MKFSSIVFSGLPASGKSTLAQACASEYGWPIYSLGSLWRQQWREKYPGHEVTFEDYWRNTSREENLQINLRAKEIFRAGNTIGESRYCHYCKDILSLLIFVTAPLEIRAQRSLSGERYQEKTLGEIEDILQKREQDETEMGKELYGGGYDYRDPQHYHLILNSSMMTVEQELAIVTSILGR